MSVHGWVGKSHALEKSDRPSVIGLSSNKKNQFEDSNGNRIQNADLRLMAEASREKYSELGQLQEVGGTQPYGMATLKRYALVSTILRQADAGGREAFLQRLDAKLQSSGESFDKTPQSRSSHTFKTAVSKAA